MIPTDEYPVNCIDINIEIPIKKNNSNATVVYY